MKIREFLDYVCEQIKYQPIRKEIAEEMENHLLEAKEHYILEGMKENEAEEEAIKQMGDAKEIGKKLNKIHRPKLDWKLLVLTLILIAFGSLVTFTRAINCWDYVDDKGVVPYFASMSRYMVTLLGGAVFSMIVYFFDYRKIFKFSNYLYVVATVLLIVTAKFGLQVNGASTYIFICGFSIYTPMLAVPLYILAFIGFVENVDKNKNLRIGFLQKEKTINLSVLKIIFLSGISLFLLEIMSARSLMFVLAIVYLMIATVKLLEYTKNRKRYLTILWGIPIVMGILFTVFVIPMAWNRLIASILPEQDPMGRGWIGVQQNMILESANLLGEADNMSNALDLFDEGTNFAFISILAHYGWMLSVGMVLAILAFSVKLIMNVVKMKDMYGKLIVVGIASLFILQSIFNLLMNFNLGFKTNINIPFISYGRQDLIVNMVCLALVLSVYRRKDIAKKNGDLRGITN